jgi:uncharacterized LabA/DUF88 family protein
MNEFGRIMSDINVIPLSVSTLGRGASPQKRGSCYFGVVQVRTYVYIDGFNFYYGAVRNTPHKWLDFKTLCKLLLQPHHDILKIKYFTALVSSPSNDPTKHVRQQVFIRALEAYIPEIEVFYGHFLSHRVMAPLASNVGAQRYVQVIRTEEKGSDVNLGIHLLNDSWMDLYDCAVVVSNDSDLAEALRLVKAQHKKIIGVITPHKGRPSTELIRHADFVGRVREGVLKASQLPDLIPGTKIHKPAKW